MLRWFIGAKNRSNLAQIVIIVFLLPFAAILLNVLSGGSAGSFSQLVRSAIDKIPLCEVWFDILTRAAGFTQEEFISSVPTVLMRSIPETVILGLSVYTCNRFHVLMKGIGLPILSTFLGVFAATLVTTVTGKIPNLAAELGVNVIIIVGMIIAFRSVFSRRKMSFISVEGFLGFIADAALGCIASAYICMFTIVTEGRYQSVGKALGSFLIITGVFILAAVLRYIISPRD